MEKEMTLRELTEALTYRDMIKQENERNFQDMFFLNPIAMIITQIDGTIVKINEATTRIMGYSKDDLYGTNVLNVYVNKEERKEIIDALKKDRCLLHHPILFYHKDGHPVPCIMSSKIIQIKGEDHILSVLFDVSIGGKNEAV